MTATDDLSVSTVASATIKVDSNPIASFTSPTQPTPGTATSFDASGSSDAVGTITNYSWNFGDPGADNTGAGPAPTHTFATRGSYTVSLTVTNDAGQTATTQQTITVDDPPTVSATPSATVTTPGSAVSFDGTATSPDAGSGGAINSVSWNFGDPGSADNTGTSLDASHAYATPGTYTATLTATDDVSVASTASTTITVDAAPTAAFTVSSNSVTAGSAVGFNAGGSSDSVGSITGYSWSFGDGTTAAGQVPSHVYAGPGVYPVSLTVTNDAGQSTTGTGTITVVSAPTRPRPRPRHQRPRLRPLPPRRPRPPQPLPRNRCPPVWAPPTSSSSPARWRTACGSACR